MNNNTKPREGATKSDHECTNNLSHRLLKNTTKSRENKTKFGPERMNNISFMQNTNLIEGPFWLKEECHVFAEILTNPVGAKPNLV
jgi:hypothetical protein